MTEQLTGAPLPQPELGDRALPRALTPFRHAAYRRLAVALVLTTFAGGVWIVALVWEVIRIGGGPGQLSVVSTAGAIGVLLPALVAGVVADRVPQKTILLCVAAVEFAGMALVAMLSFADLTQVWHLAGVAFVAGMGMAFYYPAYSAWLPALVPESDLMAVNGFEGMVRPTIGQAIGAGVAGAAVGLASATPPSGLPQRPLPWASSPWRPCRRPPYAATFRPTRQAVPSPRVSATCARASSTWCVPRGCWPRCSSPRS